MAEESTNLSEPEFIRHRPPIELSRSISISSSSPPGALGSDPATGVLKLHITTFDVFTRTDFGRLRDDLTRRFSAPGTQVGQWGRRSMRTLSWKVADRSVLVAGANATLLGEMGRHDPHILDQGIDSAVIQAWDIEGFPFVMLALVVRCDATYWAAKLPDKLGAELQQISYPLRRFIDGLGGMNSAAGVMSPRSPVVTWAAVAVDQAVFDDVVKRSKAKPRTPLLWEPRDPKYFHDIPVDPPVGFPYRLEPDFRAIHSRSMLQQSGNVAVLFGTSDRFGSGTDHCPYTLLLTSDPSLIQHQSLLPLDGPSLPSQTESFHLSGAWSIVTIISLGIWLESLKRSLVGLEVAASSSRAALRSQHGTVSNNALRGIIDANLATADRLAELGSMHRVFADPLNLLRGGQYWPAEEIPAPVNGVLSHLADNTIANIDHLKEQFSGLTRESATLAELVSSEISLQSSSRMESATLQIATQSRRANYLTITLIWLTAAIGALTAYLYFGPR